MPLRGELVDPCLADGDERELGRDEKAVGKDQRENRQQAEDEVRRIEHLTLPGATLAERSAPGKCGLDLVTRGGC